MARSRNRKLLLCDTPQASQFFDLESDPLEQQNRFDDPTRSDEIAEAKAALLQWRCFDAPAPKHLDPDAPIIDQPNARRGRPADRADLIAYYRRQMAGPADGLFRA